MVCTEVCSKTRSYEIKETGCRIRKSAAIEIISQCVSSCVLSAYIVYVPGEGIV